MDQKHALKVGRESLVRVPFPGWQKWDGCVVVPVKRKVFADLGNGRQLVGYLSVLPSSNTSFFTLRWDDWGKHVLTVNSWECRGILTDRVREEWADSCFRGFEAVALETQPEAAIAGAA